MIIRLTKAKNASKPDTLTCVRDDGSRTWWNLTPHFAQHDMLHYLVESTLGYNEAFFGLVAKGRDIDSFGTKDGQKDTYTVEESSAELIVSLLQVELSNGNNKSDAEFFSMLALTCKNNNFPLPKELCAEKIKIIRAKMQILSGQWDNLGGNESIELPFPVS